mmetsp:Transcript_30063/g.65550  ORF Transcript_30063/g.65550 Transcript_30063/m.65550 type:complete len:369 (+) Transcript_30063:99-1205(+)
MLHFVASLVSCPGPTCPEACASTEREDVWVNPECVDVDENLGFEKTVHTMVKDVFPAGPRTQVVTNYTSVKCLELKESPVHSGRVLFLSPGKPIVDVLVSLHSNGFRISPREVSDSVGVGGIYSWSPFFLVEKNTGSVSSFWAVFKLAALHFRGEEGFHFAVTGPEAKTSREKWVKLISRLLRQLTVSLFPAHTIAVQPLPGVESTTTRIMAGYLLRCQDNDVAELIYSELHAYLCGEARFINYKDHRCDDEVDMICLTASTVVSTRKGCYCTVFGVDEHLFCARTEEEKDLWLRAVSNIKVKLMFHAPDPTEPDLEVIRASVFQSSALIEPVSIEPPMLPVVPRVPPLSLGGDEQQPEPFDEDIDIV